MTKDTDKDEAYVAGENILRLAITDEERAKAYAKWERLCTIKIVMQSHPVIGERRSLCTDKW